MEIVGDDKGSWSSTRVRQAIAAGDWGDVRAVLGRPHALSGLVVRGDQRGRTIGFPTANLAEVAEVMPPNGVYAVLVDRLDRGAPRALGIGVANVGVRPTVGGGPSTEVHLLDFHPPSEADRDLYDARLRMHLFSFLRDERKFSGLDALKEQIAQDADSARRLLAAEEAHPRTLRRVVLNAMHPRDLEGLARSDLIERAEALGVDKASLLTRAELADEIVRRTVDDPIERRIARGLLGVARDLVARVVERGLHLPEAAALIRGTRAPFVDAAQTAHRNGDARRDLCRARASLEGAFGSRRGARQRSRPRCGSRSARRDCGHSG